MVRYASWTRPLWPPSRSSSSATPCAAVRDVVYFDGHDLGHPLLVLGLWPVVALLVLVAVDLLHLSERRLRLRNTNEIYGTPALVHLRRRLGARRIRAPQTG
jgi:hypothetical protein